MNPSEFAAYHEEALEQDEIRHGLLLTMIGRLKKGAGDTIRTWTLGRPGGCAMMTERYPIILANLSQEECHAAADAVKGLGYPGVIGPDETAIFFAEHAEAAGDDFSQRIPQRILILRSEPNAPRVPGFARLAVPEDFETFRAWMLAFIAEAVPYDPIPSDGFLRNSLGQHRHWFWIVDGKPVAMAATARRTKNAATINAVFTSPEYRNRGFAGAIASAVARSIFEEGRSVVTLYTDLRNPASNRCYAKLGFQPYCESWHMVRQRDRALDASKLATLAG
ncbi:MAG TPA: GNAT family N-acetyltransferase [Hyphomicrobiales bacterium]|nr:GNAT family N-acetyltransferase [Hyphomicrobiales bacterium]